MPREPTAKYIALMNAPYDRVRAACWAGATLTITYTGEWVARIDRRPAGRDRWVSAVGVTMERAVTALEEELGLGKWDG